MNLWHLAWTFRSRRRSMELSRALSGFSGVLGDTWRGMAAAAPRQPFVARSSKGQTASSRRFLVSVYQDQRMPRPAAQRMTCSSWPQSNGARNLPTGFLNGPACRPAATIKPFWGFQTDITLRSGCSTAGL